jgi:hypothetical protein
MAAATFYDDDLLDHLLRMFAKIDAHIECERHRLLALYPDIQGPASHTSSECPLSGNPADGKFWRFCDFLSTSGSGPLSDSRATANLRFSIRHFAAILRKEGHAGSSIKWRVLALSVVQRRGDLK